MRRSAVRAGQILALSLLALVARPARAQDAGTTVGQLAPADFFVGVQHKPRVNLTDFEVARFFNKANCDCDEPVYLYITLLGTGFAKRSLQATGNIEVWIGTNCTDTTYLRPTRCVQLLSEPIATFFSTGNTTLQTSARVLSTYTATGVTGQAVDDAGVPIIDEAGTPVTTTTFTPTATCTAPTTSLFTQNIWVLVDYGADLSYETVLSHSVSVKLAPPPAPGNPKAVPGNEGLVVSWDKVDSSIYTDLLGYQVLCRRGGDLQVFKPGTFTPGYKSCAATAGTSIEAMNTDFVCSPLLSRLTSSYRIKILQNDIPYTASVVAIDNTGNAATTPLVYGIPTKTRSFYDVYRDGNQTNGGPGQSATPGGAGGGLCSVAGALPRGLAAVPMWGLVAATLALARRRRRRR